MIMSVLAKLLQSYSKNHQNPTNEFIHIVAIPIILFSIVGGISAINMSLTYFTVGIVFFYYLKLSKMAGLVMFSWLGIYLVLVELLKPYIVEISVFLFIFGWALQFFGHYIEGEKPSFFDDLRHFLIGPLFVVYKLFEKFGIKIFTDNN